MLDIPWLRALIYIGFGVAALSLVVMPPRTRAGPTISLEERAIQLVLLALVASLVVRIDRRRLAARRERDAGADGESAADGEDATTGRLSP